MDKVLVAMSGGVDSSVAAFLLKQAGYDLFAAMMKLYGGEENTCCSISDVEDARSVAFRLGLPFYVFNFADTFGQEVLERFVYAYQNGATPNPCIDCNRYLKFERFLHRASEIDCRLIATGHYARIEKQGSRYLLKKAADLSKDQSYVLYAMTQPQLARTLFPLGELTKAKVREIAQAQGLVNAKKKDSQDICFAPDGDYARFIEQYTGIQSQEGVFKDKQGNTLGRHKGVIHYTVGQRKGLGLSAGEPLYVCEVCAQSNTIFVGSQEQLYAKALTARDINLIATNRLEGPVRVSAKIRYNQTEQPASVWQLDEDAIRVEFAQPQRAITKGQAVVLYDGDVVVGGGTIEAAE